MAIGVGLAVAFVAAGFWLQVRITRLSPSLAPSLMVGSLVLRLGLFAAVAIPLAAYTELNIIALLVAFVVVFTVLQAWIIRLQVKQANKAAEQREGSSGAKAGGNGLDKSVKGA